MYPRNIIDCLSLTEEEKTETIVGIVRERLGIGSDVPIDPELFFQEGFGADSLDLVEIMMAVEEYYGVDIEMCNGKTPCSVNELKAGLNKSMSEGRLL